MIVYKSMISTSLNERRKPFPYRTDFNSKSLIIAGLSFFCLILAMIISL